MWTDSKGCANRARPRKTVKGRIAGLYTPVEHIRSVEDAPMTACELILMKHKRYIVGPLRRATRLLLLENNIYTGRRWWLPLSDPNRNISLLYSVVLQTGFLFDIVLCAFVTFN